ncbi:tetratricopeptide repeat protein [uncultured Brachyspira sp.]|uniref:tetratricopeptide repeat protein n=1 Tax=uncultured Brachyspira sp. TaxID=221953 RepID=UPI002598D590|nr:tetratricopeptide repeat protein [uncultured Brachyspira sp.]
MTEKLKSKIQKLIVEKKFEEAIKLSNEAIEKDNKNYELYVGRASLKNVIGLYEDAIKDYNIAIELNNKDPKIYWQRGYTKSILIDYKGAIEDFDTAIKLGINAPRIFLDRGVIKSNLHDHTDAINDFNIAIKLNPYYAEAYNFRALSKIELGLYEDSNSDFNTAIKLNPNYYFAYTNRGLLNLFLKNYDQALKDYDYALKIDKNSIISYRYRAQIKYILGMYEDAIKDAENAINIYNNYMDAHYIKILSKAKLKRYIEIIDDLNIVAKINTNFENNFISDILNLLETYSNIEKIFQLLIKTENILLWRNEPITNLIFHFYKRKNFDDELKKNIKYLLLYEYFLLKILTFDSEKENDKIEISHYTSLDILPLLLNINGNIKESGKMRINNITTANDPKEGKILERILNKNNIDIKIENDEKALTLQTSYSRNKDSLTMFRLYGKKENKEATGICLVLDNKYFNNLYTSPYSYEFKFKMENNKIEIDEKINEEKSEENKRNLYWVLYYNEKENQLIYNKEKSKYASNIIDLNDLNNPNYKAELKEDDTKENMIKYAFAKIFYYTKEIKKEVDKNYQNIKNQLYSYLFENIKYIIKHEAFFEEQELRMLVTNDYKSDEILIDNDKKKLYIDYMPLFDERTNYIKEIIIGSKVENNEAVAEYIRKVLHIKNTEMNKLDDIKVSISEAPLR